MRQPHELPCLLLVAMAATPMTAPASAAEPRARSGSFVDVRTYLPPDHVADGTVDYREAIQKCFDENAYVYFPGSNDHARPMVYGSTAPLKTRPFSVVRFGTNAVLKRLPCFGDLLHLGQGTHLIGAVIDGNKYAHWPLLKDRDIKPYAYVTGHAVVLGGQNVIRDCFVHDLAGIAFGAWGTDDNRIYTSRAENCGFLEAMGDDFFSGEYASGDGFYFSGDARNNIVKDCEAYDCSRWGMVLTEGTRDNTFVDCRGGNVHFYCYGFIDIEGDEYANSLVRCRSHNSHITVMGSQNDLFGCVAAHINAENASFVRIIACTTTGGPIVVGGTVDSLEQNAMPSAMVLLNRVFMARPDAGGALRVACSDGKAIVAHNSVYARERAGQRGAGLALHNVGVNSGNQVAHGTWDEELAQFERPYYLRARVDTQFMEQRKRAVGAIRLKAYLAELGKAGEPAHQEMIIGEHPFIWDEADVGQAQRWHAAANRPAGLAKQYIGRHWRTRHLPGPLRTGWHFVSFQLADEHRNRQVLLHFGAVDGLADVYVNGRPVGSHDGNTETAWDQPFHFDISDQVKSGANDLAVRVAPAGGLGGPFRPISIVVW